MKDKKTGGRDRWNCDALHSIMLMRRIMMSSPQAVEADCVGVGASVFASDTAICVCVCVNGKSSKLTFL